MFTLGIVSTDRFGQMVEGLECHTQEFGLYPAFSSSFRHKGSGSNYEIHLS